MGKMDMKNIKGNNMDFQDDQSSPNLFHSDNRTDNSGLIFKEVKTSIGVMVFGSTENGLCLLDFKYRQSFPKIVSRIKSYFGENTYGTTDIIELAEKELKLYLEGKLKSFTTPLDLRGSEFQLKVWRALLQLKYGESVSYMDIANQINHPEAVRAVTNANGQNGIAVMIPCHRVIGSDGSLTGYGGGLPIKKKLLKMEGAKFGNSTSMDLTKFLS